MNEPLAPPALVLGCNTPHGIGVLSDWIEERTGYAPDFADAGWSDDSVTAANINSGEGDGTFYGSGYGDGYGVGYGGDVYGNGFGFGDGYSDGNGRGNGYIDGHGNGLADGLGSFYLACTLSGSTGNPGFWQSIGQRLRQLIR